MVPRPERHGDERQAALDRNRRDARNRPVTTGRAEHVDAGFPSELTSVLAFREDVGFDPAALRFGA